MHEAWKDPEARARMKAAAIKFGNSEKEIRERRERALKRWANPEFKKRVSQALKTTKADPASRKANSERAKARWANPEFKKRVAATIQQTMLNGSPALKQAQANLHARVRELSKDPKYRAHQAKKQKEVIAANPDRRWQLANAMAALQEDPQRYAQWCASLKAAKARAREATI
jgi:hypothetical protein